MYRECNAEFIPPSKNQSAERLYNVSCVGFNVTATLLCLQIQVIMKNTHVHRTSQPHTRSFSHSHSDAWVGHALCVMHQEAQFSTPLLSCLFYSGLYYSLTHVLRKYLLLYICSRVIIYIFCACCLGSE